MLISAKIIADSISESGKRITTLQICLPKVLIAEFNTHRVFSRNFSSSRAIPVNRVNEIDSFEPLFYGKNQPGMKAKNEEIENVDDAKKIWYDTIEYCKAASKKLNELGLHKQWSNRLNDWHVMANGIVTSTEWENWDQLRRHEDAQPEIYELACRIHEAREASIPRLLQHGEWHLPYISEEELNDPFYKIPANVNMLQKISAARCCRVSYLKHDGTSPDVDDDLALFQRLAGSVPLHASPLEHQATPDQPHPYEGWINRELHGNLVGWIQYRKLWEQEIYGTSV